jgi:hypothetical protein
VPFRRIHAPLLKLINDLTEKDPERTIAVMIPEFVKRHWWEHLLSNHRALRLRNAVLEFGGPRVVVIAVPWYLTPPKIADALTEEEVAEPVRHFRLSPPASASSQSQVIFSPAGPPSGARCLRYI